MTTPTPRRPDDLVAALADAFDTVAPTTRAAAEEELNEAGRNSAKIAARFAALAAPTTRSGVISSGRRSASDHRSRSRWWALAAMLVGVAAAALLANRTPSERIARTAPVPRAVEVPSRPTSPPALGGANGAHSVMGAEPHPRATPMAPVFAEYPVESAAETEAVAQDAAELRGMLHEEQLVPAIVASALRSGTIATREIPVAAETIARLQSPAFTAASAANAGEFEVDPLSCRLHRSESYAPVRERFGYPFPTISADSRRAGCEIMWNVEAAFAAGGGHRGRATVCGRPEAECTHLEFVSLSFVGRQSGSIDNPKGLRAASMMQVPARSGPQSGASIFRQDPLDGSGARRFLYLPELRRVRKMGPELIEVGTAGLMFAASQRDCFDANPESYKYTLIGQQDVLAPLSGEGIPLGQAADAADDAEDAPEMLTVMRRPAWVVAVSERRPYAGGARAVLYIDQELYRPYWKTEYVGKSARASYACGAAWGSAGDIIGPLTSSVTRFDPEGGRTRFVPSGEVLDQQLRAADLPFDWDQFRRLVLPGYLREPR